MMFANGIRAGGPGKFPAFVLKSGLLCFLFFRLELLVQLRLLLRLVRDLPRGHLALLLPDVAGAGLGEPLCRFALERRVEGEHGRRNRRARYDRPRRGR